MVVWKIELSSENEPQPICYQIDSVNQPLAESQQQLIAIKREDRQGMNICEPMHCHTFVEMEYVAGGTCVQNINGQEYHVKKGDVLFFDIGDKHSYTASADVQLINCMFYLDLFHNILNPDGTEAGTAYILPKVIHLSGEYILEFENILAKMENEFLNKNQGYHTILKSYISILVSLLLRFTSNATIKTNEATSAILEYLDANYAVCDLNDMAKHFNFSPSYFSRYFKRNVGMTFSQYVRNKRIKDAVRLLTTTDLTIETICTKIGFCSKNQFYKLFHEYTGMTPRDVRKQKNNLPNGFVSNG